MARSTTKRAWAQRVGRFCNSCIPRARPLYNPLYPLGVQGATNVGGPASHHSLRQVPTKRVMSSFAPVQSDRLPCPSPDPRKTSPRSVAIRMHRRSLHHAGRASVLQNLLYAVSYVASRSPSIASSRSMNSTWRTSPPSASHLRITGMGLTAVRYFRDKLAMAASEPERKASSSRIRPRLNHDNLANSCLGSQSLAAQAPLAGLRHWHEEDSLP